MPIWKINHLYSILISRSHRLRDSAKAKFRTLCIFAGKIALSKVSAWWDQHNDTHTLRPLANRAHPAVSQDTIPSPYRTLYPLQRHSAWIDILTILQPQPLKYLNSPVLPTTILYIHTRSTSQTASDPSLQPLYFPISPLSNFTGTNPQQWS